MSLARMPIVKFFYGTVLALFSIFSSGAYAVTSLCYDEFRGPDRYIVHQVDYSALDASAGTHVGLRTVPLSPAGGAVQLAYPVSPSGGSRIIDLIMGTGLYSFTGEGFIGYPQFPDFIFNIDSNMCAHTVYNSPGASSPPSVGISISPSVATVGDLVTVIWGSIGASACYFDAGAIPLGGVASFAAAPADDRTYTLECVNLWGWSYASADLTVNECDQTVLEIREEYNTLSVSPVPECDDFEQHSPTFLYSTNFTWSEYNGGWAQGNPRPNWGMIKPSVTSGLEATRSAYGRPIRVSSGYRTPAGNASIPGAANSFHMHGRAVDLFSVQSQYPWTEAEFNLLKTAADNSTVTAESFLWTTYPVDHHFHVAW